MKPMKLKSKIINLIMSAALSACCVPVAFAGDSTASTRASENLSTGFAWIVRHQKSYSLIAHALSTCHQNSNQWLLEQLAVALAPTGEVTGRPQAQRWLRERDYLPADIRIAPFERIGARLFAANVYFDDHSNDEMQAGRYQAVRVESVIRFLQSTQAVAQIQVVKLP